MQALFQATLSIQRLAECPQHRVGELPVLELGSGGGFLKKLLPGLITSDILHIPSVDIVIDGQCLPIKTEPFRWIFPFLSFSTINARRFNESALSP